MIHAAASTINTRNTITINYNRAKSDSTLFIHWKFLPSDISKNTI